MTRRILPRPCRLESGKPKKRYETRSEAKAARIRWGAEYRVYRCQHCGYFHLASPAPALRSVVKP